VPLDADLLICLDEAARQAQSRGIVIERELLLYALHGVLHCLGEDDHDPVAHEQMHAREDGILTALGIGPTFAAGDTPEAKRS
jgi:probable rRNA maturation factor